jgi:hypothetical protein
MAVQSPAPTSPPSSTAGNLSAGVKAGIVIGVGLVGFLILCAVVFIFSRERRAAKRQSYYDVDAKPWETNEIDRLEIRHPIDMSASRTFARHIVELEYIKYIQ